MKKLILVLALLPFVNSVVGQPTDAVAVELELKTPYYFVDNATLLSGNLGFSLLASRYTKGFKFSTGFSYNFKSFTTEGFKSSSSTIIAYDLQYYNIPLLFNFYYLRRDTYNFGFVVGSSFSYITNFQKIIGYPSSASLVLGNDNVYHQLGISLIFGPTFSKRFDEHWSLNIAPSLNWTVASYHANNRPDIYEIPDNQSSLFLRVGIEYVF